jgi:protein-tyrosine phosphatase
MTKTRPPRVLMVCLGNICRSPMAQGALEGAARRVGLAIEVDSAGTGGWHVGAAPDPRAVAAAARRGYDISDQRARRATPEDLGRFDHVLAMDASNLRALLALRRSGSAARLTRLRDLVGGGDVPDPYHGGPEDFERALDLIETAAAALAGELLSAAAR